MGISFTGWMVHRHIYRALFRSQVSHQRNTQRTLQQHSTIPTQEHHQPHNHTWKKNHARHCRMQEDNTRFGRRQIEAGNQRPKATGRCNQKFHRPQPQLHGTRSSFVNATVRSDGATSSNSAQNTPYPPSEHDTFACSLYSNARSKCAYTCANHNATSPYTGKKTGATTSTPSPAMRNSAH